MHRGSGLRLSPGGTPLAQARWILGRVYLKGRVCILPALVLAHRTLSMFRVVKISLSLKRTLTLARRYFRKVKPDVIALAEDNVSYPTGLLIRAAHESGAASVVVPFTLASVREFVEGFGTDREHTSRGFINRVAARLFPKWCHVEKRIDPSAPAITRERWILRLPGPHILALEWLGLRRRALGTQRWPLGCFRGRKPADVPALPGRIRRGK